MSTELVVDLPLAPAAAAISTRRHHVAHQELALEPNGVTRATIATRLRRIGGQDPLAGIDADFRDRGIADGKQAEFLLHQCFPWELVARVGVYSRVLAAQAGSALAAAPHQPVIEVLPRWYY